MKILHLSSEYPPQKVFGLGRFVCDLSRQQVLSGHEVHVITNSMGTNDHEVVDEGVFVHRVHFPSPPKPPDNGTMIMQFNFQVVERFLSDLNFIKPDIINAHDWLTALSGKLLADYCNAKFIITIHDMMVTESNAEDSKTGRQWSQYPDFSTQVPIVFEEAVKCRIFSFKAVIYPVIHSVFFKYLCDIR